MSFEIGYRKPPKDKRFKKGQSGNPKGRPTGSNNFMTLLDRELRQPITITENGKKKKITRLSAMTKRLVGSAMQGDYKALSTLIDILRKEAPSESKDPEIMLTDDYEAILEDYVARRAKNPKSAEGQEDDGGDSK